MGGKGFILNFDQAASAMKALGFEPFSEDKHDVFYVVCGSKGPFVQVHKKGLVSRTAIGEIAKQIRRASGIEMNAHAFMEIARSPRPDRAFESWNARKTGSDSHHPVT